MARRLWSYFMMLQLRHRRPVLSIVVYLRGGPPGVTQEIHEHRFLDRTTATFQYIAFGLAGGRAEDALEGPEPLGWALAALMRAPGWSRAEHKLRCLKRIVGARVNDVGRFLLVNCVETYLDLKDEEAAEYDELRHSGDNEEVASMEMTWADRLEAKGFEKGVEALRQVVLRQLARRFGSLPEATGRRVEAIRSVEQLSDLAEKVVTADSLEDLGL